MPSITPPKTQNLVYACRCNYYEGKVRNAKNLRLLLAVQSSRLAWSIQIPGLRIQNQNYTNKSNIILKKPNKYLRNVLRRFISSKIHKKQSKLNQKNSEKLDVKVQKDLKKYIISENIHNTSEEHDKMLSSMC